MQCCKQVQKAKTLINGHHVGRPCHVSEREERHIVRINRKTPKISSSEIAAQIHELLGKQVHPKTVRRMFHQAGYKARVPRKMPYISKANRKKRLQFANQYVTKDPDFWNRVIFSDESKFNLFHHDGRILVWRRRNAKLEPANMTCTVKYGGGGIMVWGCMAASGVGNLVFIDGTMDQYVYLDILKRNLKVSAEKLGLNTDYHFQQDNDPKHTAYNVRLWILYNAPHTLQTPPQSPDMNPIEHLWDELERRIRKHHISSKAQLKEVIVQECGKIDAAVTRKLVQSMQDRLKAVIRSKGMNTRY